MLITTELRHQLSRYLTDLLQETASVFTVRKEKNTLVVYYYDGEGEVAKYFYGGDFSSLSKLGTEPQGVAKAL